MTTSKDNFHLLLSELDEEGVIRFGIIPYLKQYLKKIDKNSNNSIKIIDNFINLKSVYESFYTIIKTDDLTRQMEVFSDQFRKYNPRKKGEELSAEESQKRADIAREKLAVNDISPFILGYKIHVESKIEELENYLDEQNQSDSDIISLI